MKKSLLDKSRLKPGDQTNGLKINVRTFMKFKVLAQVLSLFHSKKLVMTFEFE